MGEASSVQLTLMAISSCQSSLSPYNVLITLYPPIPSADKPILSIFKFRYSLLNLAKTLFISLIYAAGDDLNVFFIKINECPKTFNLDGYNYY